MISGCCGKCKPFINKRLLSFVDRSCLDLTTGSYQSVVPQKATKICPHERGISLTPLPNPLTLVGAIGAYAADVSVYLCCTCAVPVVYLWSTCAVHVVYLWSTCAVHVVYLCCTCGLPVLYMWSTCAVTVVYLCCTCGLPVMYLWSTCAVPVLYLCCTCAVPVLYLCCINHPPFLLARTVLDKLSV